MVYRLCFRPWWIAYRYRDSSGNWTPIEYIRNLYYIDQPDIIEDAQGRPNIFYCAGENTPYDQTWTDIWHAVKQDGEWTYTKLTNTVDNRAYPRAAIDEQGRIHLVHIRWNLSNGLQGSVMYRMQTPTGWTEDTSIGNIRNVYYHHPDINIDDSGNVHVVWVDSQSGQFALKYRRKAPAGSWSATQVLGMTPNDAFSYPKIAWAGGTDLIAVVREIDTVVWVHSADRGQTWSPKTPLIRGAYPNLDTDPSGGIHLVHATQNDFGIAYRRWTPTGGWTDHFQITPNSAWQLFPDITTDIYDNLHVVYQDNLYATNRHLISHTMSERDITPPEPVTQFSATVSDGAAYLTWRNPPTQDFTGTILRRKANSPPADIDDGDHVTSILASPGSISTFNDSGLVNGTTYHYSAFAHDNMRNYALPTQLEITPYSLSINQIRHYDDNHWIQLTNRVITGIFPSDGCFYIQDKARTGGIRVAGSTSGLAVGDRVNVSGIMGTRMLSGHPSEREIRNATVIKESSDSPPDPLNMTCFAVGGSPAGPLVPGVIGGMGLNNIGLLVRITGEITFKVSNIIHIDDGSRISDPSGRTGIMVRCPSSSIPYNVGDIVSVTGIVAGSIQTGTNTNRRYIQTRNWNDLQKHN